MRARRRPPGGSAPAAKASDQSARVSPEMRGFGVALGAVLHVARLGRSAAVQPGAIAPLGIELNSVRRIGHHQKRLARRRSNRATASALVASPQSTRCSPQSHRSPGRRPGCSGTGGATLARSSSSGRARKSSISCWIEPGQLEIEVEIPQFFEFRPEQIEIPVGLLVAAVVHQPVRFDLRRRQVVGDVDGNLLQPQLLRGQQPDVATDDDAVLIDDDGLPPAKFLDATPRPCRSRARESCGCFGRKESALSIGHQHTFRSFIRTPAGLDLGSFGGCALRWPVEPVLPALFIRCFGARCLLNRLQRHFPVRAFPVKREPPNSGEVSHLAIFAPTMGLCCYRGYG